MRMYSRTLFIMLDWVFAVERHELAAGCCSAREKRHSDIWLSLWAKAMIFSGIPAVETVILRAPMFMPSAALMSSSAFLTLSIVERLAYAHEHGLVTVLPAPENHADLFR